VTNAQPGRIWRRGAATVAAGTALALVFGGVAHADNLQDNIVDTTGGVTLVAGSSTGGIATIRVVGNNSDGATTDPGCNWDTGEAPLVLDVVTPAGVTATPDPVSFTACGVDKTVTFTAGATAVSGTATVRIVSTPAGGGEYNNQVSIPITVTRPNTPPVVSVTGVDSASYEIGHEPTPGCSVVDAEEPDAAAVPAVDRRQVASTGLGTVTVTCSFTDAGGLEDSDTVSYTITPPPNTKPSVSVQGVVDGAAYEIGSVPVATCDVTDAEDGNSTTVAGLSGTLLHGLGTQTATCDYTDQGGLSAETVTATYSIVDTGVPTIRHQLAPAAANTNGWYSQDVTVDFVCDDSGSGIMTCVGDTTLGEGANQSANGTATDWAGNTATDAVSGINVDKTAPTVGFTGGPGASYHFGSDPAAPVCDASDALSGIAGCVVTGGGTSVGAHSYTATATDKAGNTATATLNYTVLPWTLRGFTSPVDMSGVWNTVKGGSTVPLKFEAFAASELTTTSAIKSFTQRQVTCPGGSAITDDIEITSTGGTSLRYDTTGGQFIQNWATPKKPGTCHAVTMTTQDGSTVSANFILK